MLKPIPGAVTIVDHPLVRVKLTELRDAKTSPQVFRQRLSELATLMAFEVTRDMETAVQAIQTPLAPYEGCVNAKPIVIAPILRAGLGMLEGMLKILSDASVAHVGLYRNEETHEPESYYFKAPFHIPTAEVIVCDPMLATGGSAAAAIANLKRHGAVSIRYVCLVSCRQGIERLQREHPEVRIFTAEVDPELNERAYIVPGLGDAGDRYFGTVEAATDAGN